MRHFVIPDVQAKPGIDFSYLSKIGEYIADKQPEKIICLGDFADMPSLSSYDVGKRSFEGRRYLKDIDASHDAMEALLGPVWDLQKRQKSSKHAVYRPKMVMIVGNHENRINRAVNNDAKLEGVLSMDALGYVGYGWQVIPFLEVHIEDGVAYSHYFTTGLMGRPVTTASACLSKKHQSCVQGHQQGLQIATSHRADGTPITAIIAGSCYEHDEDYMSSQGNKHWRGAVMLHEVHDGAFDVMPLSLKYFKERK